MASDAYFRCAVAVDRSLITHLGDSGVANMAAHWCLIADTLAPCPASRSPEAMIRTQLMARYRVRKATIPETVALLREKGRWQDIRAAFARRSLSQG